MVIEICFPSVYPCHSSDALLFLQMYYSTVSLRGTSMCNANNANPLRVICYEYYNYTCDEQSVSPQAVVRENHEKSKKKTKTVNLNILNLLKVHLCSGFFVVSYSCLPLATLPPRDSLWHCSLSSATVDRKLTWVRTKGYICIRT